MVAGEIVERPAEDVELGYGEALTANGRLSVAREYSPAAPKVPFKVAELAQLDEALTLSSRQTGLAFSVYLGDLDGDTRQAAETLHARSEDPAISVLVAVSPTQRAVEIVTGAESHRRLPDRGCKLAVMSMVASFKEGDLIGGLVSGLRMMTDQAGAAPRR
ncbi:DUF5130 family protein [Kutzneria viridogrisea]|uniref:DUF5130 domain-containing protein n=2 Tax=Kutzneria TaxID=43356 RepID=W5W9L8_9PSEU|nr:DUF5130 family protein [Kutzneria albida]AHH94899.1 hypothetical protein KALB_1527 [Kutzneria albida DSM 43870]MBA8927769.1 hypothetical protein [Kutzneria viridogrisea]